MKTPRILLCLPYWAGRNHSVFLGTCDLVDYLRRCGVKAEAFDYDVAHYAAQQEGISAHQLLLDALTSFNPSFVGIHVNTPNYHNATTLAQMIKDANPAIKIIAGGPHASVAWKEILAFHREFDYVCMGEGESPLAALLFQCESTNGHHLPPGIAGRLDNGEPVCPKLPVKTCCKLPCSDRSVLLESPFPLIRKWAVKRYQDNFYNAIASFEGRMTTNAYAARGCLKSCPYCFPGQFWLSPSTSLPQQRVKSIEALRKEFDYLSTMGYGAVYFDEMAFPLYNRMWVDQFLTAIKEFGLFWGASVLFDQVRHIDLNAFYKSGLRYLYFGFETPSRDLQKTIRKETNGDEVLAFIHSAFSVGIQCDLSMFFGSPGETDDSIRNTVDWLNANLPLGNAFFSVAAIWPGTEWATDFKLNPICWEDFYPKESLRKHAIWYSHDMTSIGKFFSNSLGTYHPPFMTEEKALWIRSLIIESGFRDRFSRFARKVNHEN